MMISKGPECQLKSDAADPAIRASLNDLSASINETFHIVDRIKRAGLRLGLGPLNSDDPEAENNKLSDDSVHGAVNQALSRVHKINYLLDRIAEHFDSLI